LFGELSYRASLARQGGWPSLRVAAIAVDAPRRPGSMFAAMDREELAAVIARYESRIMEVSVAGAVLVVLPEMAAVTHTADAEHFQAQLAQWARAARVVLVANYFDADQRRNLLVIADERGNIAATYDKQHPVRGVEPKSPAKMLPAFYPGGTPVSG